MADTEPLCAAHYVADGFADLPRSDAPDFRTALMRFCLERNVGLVIPTRDGELPVMADLFSIFAGNDITIAVSARAAVDAARDKMAFSRLVTELGFDVPAERDRDDPAAYPIFVRDLCTSGGSGARIVNTIEEAAAFRNRREGYLFQEVVDAEEYTIDVLCDLQG